MSGKELKCATSPKGANKSQTKREKLQKRIAKAQQQGRYNKVKALEYLLKNSERQSLAENK
ncbi:reverse transcriptase N-terminal domain-containing protein [Bacteroides finegoldii]|uniref:reverse transcriptase N-terminal domain-containing protein n=1 Tax=Bacteroides finegoldii TaxID=338188 RepID=UPI0018A0B988|nr:reverse transcriptase N-terminal domain-containing protein [Bacteroides finegoldii]